MNEQPTAPAMARNEYLEVADWRRRVALLWQAWRDGAAEDPDLATQQFRAAKDDLFADHPQSPLLQEERAAFRGLDYFPYDPTWRLTARVELDDAAGPPEGLASAGPIDLPSSGLGGIPFRRIGRVHLAGPLDGQSLPIFWIDAYGGGLFLPFRDATSGSETYGAGRYLLDTIKSADHGAGAEPNTITLDFNMAYHPSCAYDPQWSCPLAPLESRLSVPVRVGERMSSPHG